MLPLGKHPLIVLSAGLAAGFLVYKYRDEILERARRAAEQTDEIMRGSRERLEAIGDRTLRD